MYGNLGGTTNRGDSPLLTSLSLSFLSSLLTFFPVWPRRGRPFLFPLLDYGGRFGLFFFISLPGAEDSMTFQAV